MLPVAICQAVAVSSVLCFSIVARTGIFHPYCIHVLPAVHVFLSWLLHVDVATLGMSYCIQPSDLPQEAVGGVAGQMCVWLECIEMVMLSLSWRLFQIRAVLEFNSTR